MELTITIKAENTQRLVEELKDITRKIVRGDRTGYGYEEDTNHDRISEHDFKVT